MVDEAAKKAREEYLKKYLNSDDKSSTTKKHKKKKRKNAGIGLKIHEEDAFVAVRPCSKQSSSGDDESEKDIKVIGKAKLSQAPKFKRAAFESVDIKVEADIIQKRHDSSDDEDKLDEQSVPGTSGTQARTSDPSNKSNQKIKNWKNSSDSDASPPRRRPRIKEEPQDSDVSPPRRHTNVPDSANVRISGANDSDVSPPRRVRKRVGDDDSDSDASPPRRHIGDARRDSDRTRESECQKRRRSDSDDDTIIRRRRSRNRDSDDPESPVRSRNAERRRSRDRSSSRHHRHREGRHERRNCSDRDNEASHHSSSKHGRPKQNDIKSATIVSKSAGLKTLEAHREEMKHFKENEAKMLQNWEEYTSGKDAAAIRRGKLTGKGRETKEERERKEREAKKQQELEEKYKKWNKGLRQIEERTEKLNEMARVAQEDFARHADDEAMNKHMKEQLYEKDPMFNYVKKKKEKAEIKSGTSYPKYNGSWPPNRFNIAPGYRWDGVNRSNGFEDKIAETANRKAAQRTEYYENIAKYEV